METTAIASVMVTIFLWGVVSARLERADLTAPIVFTAVGALLARLGLVHGSVAPEALRPLVEVTLVWVLFSDAARVRVHDLRDDLGRVPAAARRRPAADDPGRLGTGRLAASPDSGCGWRSFSVRRWPPPTPRWACRS